MGSAAVSAPDAKVRTRRPPGWVGAAFLLSAKFAVGLGLLYLGRGLLHDDPLWAYISLIVVGAEPAAGSWRASLNRFIHTLLGGFVGLLALELLPLDEGALIAAVAVTVFVGFAFFGAPTSWKLAPVTAAIVMGQAIAQRSRELGIESGSRRVIQVSVGSLLAVVLSIAFDRLTRAWVTWRSHSANAASPQIQ